ncbi:two-component regulator propeller domain-containing protein [Algoriphagus sp. C2-6-M1]|uniref:two-component regulator propeller domain-containing protein n=1 Tax=Algoriphagus persicinus TaxID=3108754 RepID=UPI002B3917F4|nr:two-component regulator propeller domain-containing protein [Algoriphagus sp. C2-6-M1]MEB2782519.1 two-component regulator propeller domain-containing protein [Algoriphagus sp. C2-6-M1]
MRKFLFFLGGASLFFSCTNVQDNKTVATPNPMALPAMISLDKLADTIRPIRVNLTDVPKPVRIKLPTQAIGSYTHLNESGTLSTINLNPPASQHLPYLTDENDQIIRNTSGKPFIQGDGGISQFKNFTTDNGLALDAVNSAVLDSRGHLWFATNGGGVSRFDGIAFTNYTTSQGLAGNTVRVALEDSQGILWFGTVGGGVSSYDGHVFTTYTTENGLGDDAILSIMEDSDSNIWFGTYGGGVSKYDGNSFTTFTTDQGLADDVVISIAEDHSGAIWFGTNGGGVSQYDGSSFTNYTITEGLPSNRIRSIKVDHSGTIWFGTIGGGVSRYDGQNFKTIGRGDGLASLVIRAIVETIEGTLWFATEHGVSKYDGKNMTTYTREQGLASNSILDIVIDVNGRLWFCTEGGGVSRFDGSSFTNFTSSQGLGGNIVLSTVEDKDGNLWFGTAGGGVSRFDGERFTSYTATQGLVGEIVSSSHRDQKDQLWFGTGGGGVSMFDGEAFTNYTITHGLAANEVYNINEDYRGNLWFGTDGGGVSKYDGKGFTTYTTQHGLPGDVILGIAEDNFKKLWFGAADGGLSRFDGDTFTNFTSDQGLADNAVIRLVKDKQGNLWVGSENGLSILSAEKIKQIEGVLEMDDYRSILEDSISFFQTFTTAEGLPDNMILQIAELPEGKMAIGTNLGIAVFDGAPDGAPLDSLRNIEIFNSETGFPVKDLVDGQNGMYVDRKGILWAGTGNNKTALVRFDYKKLKRNHTPPSVLIKELRLSEEVISWHTLNKRYEGISANTFPRTIDELIVYGKELNDLEREDLQNKFKGIEFDSISGFYPLPQNLVLPYRNNDINIDFGTDELSKPYLIEYQYILEGYDEKWSPILKKTTANFGNIQEGKYTFKVKARFTGAADSGAGEWTVPMSYSFEVLPPLYRTWWAYLFYGLLFISLIYPITIYQRNQVLKAENERTKERELQHAKAIEVAYTELASTHENLKETQAQLLHSEKMASLGELMAGIAHEIQNPLNFVNNFSEVTNELVKEIKEERTRPDAERDAELEDDILKDIESNLEKITKHGKRAGAIVKGMLQHSRSGKGAKEPMDINVLADEYLRLSYHGLRAKDGAFNSDFEMDFDSTLPTIPLVSQDVGRVLLNLFNNAFYAVNEKKKEGEENYKPLVTVKTSKIELSKYKSSIQIKVTDNGKGIPKAIVEKVFQPFFTTKPTGQGTGLGLSLSYDIIKAHNGEIRVESTEGEGTTFTISLYISSSIPS